ncbi:MAG: FecR domain-containing protein [Bdellovibrionales bacterium]|nr:FecR domain-containing protein [Bdellovibrionales bacterium]
MKIDTWKLSFGLVYGIAIAFGGAVGPAFGHAGHLHGARVESAIGKSFEVRTSEKGDVEVPLKRGSELPPGSRVHVGPKAGLTLRLGDDVVVVLRAESRVRLELRGGKDWAVALEEGALLSTVKNPRARPEHFSVRTKSAVMGVRGTTFYARDRAGSPTYFCTCHGRIDVRGIDEKPIGIVEAKHHDSPTEIVDGKLVKVAMDADHTDADVAAIEKILASPTGSAKR